ncbi:hypothetical protein [Haladaptatus sp. DFWS20]|uniref:hypothetical protein n=1 Tax=Haladaptatus sp. DFWS20 TaxID=3403467 RepID=UPI003EBBB789
MREEKRNLKTYVNEILTPAAEVLHEHDKKVVGPSATVEWWGWDMDVAINGDPTTYDGEAWGAKFGLDNWLEYQDAWKHIDVLSLHYLKGDVNVAKKHKGGDSMIPLLDHVYEKYIEPGRLEGIYLTEEGLTENDDKTALEPWEQNDPTQWLPQYIIPVLDWSIRHDWTTTDQFKLFWYNMNYDRNDKNRPLEPTMLLDRDNTADNTLRKSSMGETLTALTDLLTGADSVTLITDRVTVGYDITDEDASSFESQYAFLVNYSIFVASWADPKEEADESVEVLIKDIDIGTVRDVVTVDYQTGERMELSYGDGYEWIDRGTGSRPDTILATLPATNAPVKYLWIDRKLNA